MDLDMGNLKQLGPEIIVQADPALRREADMLTAIIQTHADLAAEDMDMRSVMSLVAERTARITEAPAAVVGLLEDGAIHYCYGCGVLEYHTDFRLPIGAGITKLCLETGETIHCRDAESDPRVNRISCRELGMRSLITVPLRHNGSPMGVLTIYSPEPHAFSDLDARVLELMAGFVGAAMARTADMAMRNAAVMALCESEARFRHVWDTAADGMRLTDEHGTIVMVNEAYCRIVGMEPESLIGQAYSVVYRDREGGLATFERRIRERSISRHLERECVLADGRRLWLEISNSLIEMENQGVLLLSAFRDVTERRAAEKTLKHYQLLAENTHDIMIFSSLDGKILEVNEAALRAYGYTREEMTALSVHDLRHASRETLESCLRDAAERPLVYSTQHRRKDGSVFPVEMSLQCMEIGDERLLLGIARDTTERTAFEQQLEHRAFHDPLTELPNRALFTNRLRHALRAARERHSHIAVLFLDVDRFKLINDSLGHHAGDQLLAAIAARLQACLRGVDTAARFGGDEFTILLEDIRCEGDAIRTADRILRKLQAPFDVLGEEVYASVSIGVAVSSGEMRDPEEFLRDADLAMYQAKDSGRGRHVLFAREMGADTRERLQLETDLRRAIERDEFQVFYQPIVLMETKRTIGVEALVRWHHPRFGLMVPDAFVPLQEQIGLIEPFTMWVLREAQVQCLALQQQGWRLGVSVNLSVHNLHEPGFAKRVGQILEETGLSPSALKLEITESAVMMNPPRALSILSELNAMGVRLSVDDFGTGYSSLSYLSQLPVQEIKIDKSFVLGMSTTDDDDAAIVRATIDLAHNLRKKVVAEGVESQAVWDLLNLLGCDAAQGYHMARPMTADQLTEWLRTSPYGLPELRA